MGVYDRDWWRERYNQRTGRDEALKAAPIHTAKASTPADLPGVNWHWTVKLLAIGWIAFIAYVLAKLAMGLRL